MKKFKKFGINIRRGGGAKIKNIPKMLKIANFVK
jgi:hypothetical protein